MTYETIPWDAPAWGRISQAEPGQASVVAALQALRDVCGVAAAVGQRTPEFSPGSGWHTADGALALLEMTSETPVTDELVLAGPPSTHAAEAAVDALFRLAADHTLATTLSLQGSTQTEQVRVLAAVMQQLSDGYQLVFDRPW